jgi:hypothetical protein
MRVQYSSPNKFARFGAPESASLWSCHLTHWPAALASLVKRRRRLARQPSRNIGRRWEEMLGGKMFPPGPLSAMILRIVRDCRHPQMVAEPLQRTADTTTSIHAVNST